MFIIYNENELRTSFAGFDISKINPNRAYRRHLENYFYLRFLSNHPDNTFEEQQQCGKEMPVAERKMAFWERQATFNQRQKEADIAEVKHQWKQ